MDNQQLPPEPPTRVTDYLAIDRTVLSNERTFLAMLRTALALDFLHKQIFCLQARHVSSEQRVYKRINEQRSE